MYETAYKLVTELFEGKVDKANQPYINHLLGVANQGQNEYEKTLGLLHDLFEDTTCTSKELRNLGFPMEMIEHLQILTKPKGASYQTYIEKILQSEDLIVLRIKKYDLLNNLDPQRRALLTDQQKAKFSQKYEPVLIKINEQITKLEASINSKS